MLEDVTEGARIVIVESGGSFMTIEVTNPEVEALIQQRMRAGSFKSLEDLIIAALSSATPDPRTGAELVAALQACPYPEVDIEPTRVSSPLVRDVTF